MTRTKELKEKIKKQGIKYNFIASQLNLTYAGLKKKIDNESKFDVCEVKKMCEILNITKTKEMLYIFFADDVELK